MAILNCYVDDRTMDVLREVASRTGRTVNDLAEAAISDAAVQAIPPQNRASVFGRDRASRDDFPIGYPGR